VPLVSAGRRARAFVKAGVSILVERVKLPRSEEARRDDHQVVASLHDRDPDGT
jgi:hypothetical protein